MTRNIPLSTDLANDRRGNMAIFTAFCLLPAILLNQCLHAT